MTTTPKIYSEVYPPGTDLRNLINPYKYWQQDAIIADLDDKRFNYSVVCCNFGSDFNIGAVVRNSNAFLAKEVVLLGRKKYDRRSTVGTHKYTNFRHVKSLASLDHYLQNKHVIGIDNIDNATPIDEYKWPTKREVVMIFGQEDIGIPNKILAKCNDIVYIRQYGSVRSLNVGCASAIAMFTYVLNQKERI